MMISRKPLLKMKLLRERKYYVLEFYTEQMSLALKCKYANFMKNKQIKQHWILATDTVAGVAYW